MSINMMALATTFVAATAVAAAQTPAADFAMKAARGGHAEVMLGKLALGISTNAALKAAAKKIELDHASASEELRKMAAAKHWMLPAEADLGTDGSNALNYLKTLKGAAFDTAWIDHMIDDHQKDVVMYTAETKCPDADVRAFAERTLPLIQSHLDMVRRLKDMQPN